MKKVAIKWTGRFGEGADLRSDMVKDRQQHRVEDARPERRSEGGAVVLQGVKEHLHTYAAQQ